MKVTVTIRHAKLQSNRYQQHTITQYFYRPDALPVAQPTVSEHKQKQRQKCGRGLTSGSTPMMLPRAQTACSQTFWCGDSRSWRNNGTAPTHNTTTVYNAYLTAGIAGQLE